MNYEEMKIARLRRSDLGKMLTDSDQKIESWKRHFLKEKFKNKSWLPWLNLAARRGVITRMQQIEMLLCFEARGFFTIKSFELGKALFGLAAVMWLKCGRPWWAATNFSCDEFESMFIVEFERAAMIQYENKNKNNPPPPRP